VYKLNIAEHPDREKTSGKSPCVQILG